MPVKEDLYKQYLCSRNAPLNCDRPLQTAQEIPGAKFCLECGFPATLAQNSEIKGNRGIYQVGKFLCTRSMGRLYSGIQISDNQSVVIKEYLLPNRCFNAEETRQCKQTFQQVAGVSLADGRNQNFRLIEPWEAIADERGERCYIITKGVEASQTLSQYLIAKGAMDAPQVRQVLNQTLQTLQFLHTSSLRFPSNQVQRGLAHGNLNLDSILIKVESNQQFYTYLDDLAIWESLFYPPPTKVAKLQPEQDLVALGLVAFYLWAGKAVDSTSGQPLNPRKPENWSNSDPHLQQFLYHLIGLDKPFESAEAARKALLQLPKENQASGEAGLTALEQPDKIWRSPLILLAILALLLLGGGIWYFFLHSGLQAPNCGQWCKLLSGFSEVSSVPAGEFTYTAETNSTWSTVLKQKPESGTLEENLTKPKPDVTFNYQSVPSSDVKAVSVPIEKVRSCQEEYKEKQSCQAYFAITSLNVDQELESKPVAYDGLLVFVGSSKDDSAPVKVLKGKISLEQLRQIYTGKITNWRELGGSNLSIQPYAPTEPEAVRLFQQQVLKDDPQQIALYKEVTKQFTEITENTQKQIRAKFEKGEAGIISFGILSKTWNQCNGYPLALVDDNNRETQPLLQLNNQPINPEVNLCDRRYYFDIESFRTGRYPLGYPLNVVYPKDNSLPNVGSKFAEMLTTREGQCLLKKVGLVPLQIIPENDKIAHGC
ncbi:substrate-binding domain-containing protein [Nostoc sp. XA010]|uniref:substrate-binding domain-containing protein n=1 Tax=Nostoc sp. XA010 TaxID=2780407 RepID=UPI001E4407D3|nr:substrate-binding domain-containing protein [Nostoc sp. XA010]MCC5659021.1 substrate-binding domain-containing protein [Nostoc sp. XA010]